MGPDYLVLPPGQVAATLSHTLRWGPSEPRTVGSMAFLLCKVCGQEHNKEPLTGTHLSLCCN